MEHTPGPCGCEASCLSHSVGDVEITYCSLHAAASELLKALKSITPRECTKCGGIIAHHKQCVIGAAIRAATGA